MNILQQFKTFGPVDSKYIRRDDINLILIFAPLLLGMGVRWLIPLLFEIIGNLIGLEILPYLNPIMGYCLIIMMPLFSGMITGLILLDQKDDHTILGLQVSPVPMTNYLFYRLITPMLLSFLMTMIVYPLSNLQSIGFLSLVGGSLLAMPLAPIFALAFAIFAENKIQGLVLMKGSGAILFLPIIAYFMSAIWKYAFAIVPTFWAGQFYWLALEHNPARWIIWVAGISTEAVLTFWLQKYWLKKIHS